MTDTLQVANTLNAATRAHLELHQAIGEQRSSQGERVSGTREAQVPINIDAMDQRDLLGDQIVGWASIVEEETGQQCDRLNAQVAGRWMVGHADWIANAEWADVLVEELRSTTKHAEAMLGQLPKRTPIEIPCECGQRQWIVHESKMYVRCAHGHEAPLADHRTMPDGEPVTVTQASRLLGMNRSTLGRMIDRGDVAFIGSPPKIPRHEVANLKSRLAFDQRGH